MKFPTKIDEEDVGIFAKELMIAGYEAAITSLDNDGVKGLIIWDGSAAVQNRAAFYEKRGSVFVRNDHHAFAPNYGQVDEP
jgi:hypothetical protein